MFGESIENIQTNIFYDIEANIGSLYMESVRSRKLKKKWRFPAFCTRFISTKGNAGRGYWKGSCQIKTLYGFGNKITVGVVAFVKSVAEKKKEKVQAREDIEEYEHLAEQILDSYGDAILRLAYSYLHNMADAEEMLQETLIKYLDHRTDFADAEHEKAWLFKVAANLSKNRISYNKVRETDELSDTLVAQEREDLSFVWEAVKKLPQNYRAAIHLFYYEGYATAEIAKILERKESSVRSDLRRGRLQLKNILKEEYDFE